MEGTEPGTERGVLGECRVWDRGCGVGRALWGQGSVPRGQGSVPGGSGGCWAARGRCQGAKPCAWWSVLGVQGSVPRARAGAHGPGVSAGCPGPVWDGAGGQW